MTDPNLPNTPAAAYDDDGAAAAAPADDRLTPLGPPPKVLSPLFWLLLLLGVVCVLIGVAVAMVGPKLYPRDEPPIATVPR